MLNKKILPLSALHALGVTVYVICVSFLLSHAQAWFGRMEGQGLWIPVVMLMLLTLSVAIVGSLIFVRPALWALAGQKKEALYLLLSTLGCLAGFLIILFALLASRF